MNMFTLSLIIALCSVIAATLIMFAPLIIRKTLPVINKAVVITIKNLPHGVKDISVVVILALVGVTFSIFVLKAIYHF